MAKTWEQIIAEVGTVSEEQHRRDRTELLESMGMTWYDFMQTSQFHEMAQKIAEARAAHAVKTLVEAHRIMTEQEKAKEPKEAGEEAAAAEAAEK